MAAQWPIVATRLVALLPTLPGWSAVAVFDGPPVTGDVPTDYATVGYIADVHAGSYTSVQEASGLRRVEVGHVSCQLTSNTGDTDLPSVRSRVFALADAVESYVRGNRTLGGTLSAEGTVEFAVDVMSTQNDQGAGMSLIFTFHYSTVT